MSGPWLSIIGIGEDGLAGLGDVARKCLADASFVIGGKRHLALAKDAIAGEQQCWPVPFADAIPLLMTRRGQKVAVLASGDPFTFGVGPLLTAGLDRGEWQAFPAPSSFTLAAARLGWALQDTDCLSLCGRPLETLASYLQPGRRLLVLSADAGTPAMVARYLNERGFGQSRLAVLEALGGPNERSRWTAAAGFDFPDVQALNIVALKLEAAPAAMAIPCTSGLDDALFEHDGQITKREIRAITLSSLAPRAGERLWDIGCGSGSIAIEWLLAHPANQAIGIEKNAERAARARRNAATLGVPQLQVVDGAAGKKLFAEIGLSGPDAIFIGGGVHELGLVGHAWDQLPLGGRIVANAVTLESEAALLAAHSQFGGTLLRLDVSRSDSVGRLNALRPAMTVTQWIATKCGLVAGIGCRSESAVEEICVTVVNALNGARRSMNEVVQLAAPDFRAGTTLDLAAERLGIPLVLVSRADLEAVQARCLTQSTTVARLTGLSAVAEAAALAVAGTGAALLGPRLASDRVTCAIARRAP